MNKKIILIVGGIIFLALSLAGSGKLESGWDSFSRVGVWIGACLLFLGIFLSTKNHFNSIALNRVAVEGDGLKANEGRKWKIWMLVGVGFILLPFLINKILFGSSGRGGADAFFLLVPAAGLFVLIGIILVIHSFFKRQ